MSSENLYHGVSPGSPPGATSTTLGGILLAGDLAGTGSVATAPRVGSVTGVAGTLSVRVGTRISFDGGASAAAATGLIGLPNASSIRFRNFADTLDIVGVGVDAANGVNIGNGGTVTASSVAIAGTNSISLLTPTVLWRESGGTTRVTITHAAASIVNVAAATSLALQSNGSGRILLDATGLSFFGVATVARAAALTQTYATVSRTNPAMTSVAVATTAATSVGPFGYTTAAQADAIPVAINALRVDVEGIKQFVNAMADDFQAYGLEQ